MDINKKYVLSILVANHSGVLTKLAGLFARRGYNIDSLSVGETNDPLISRITVVMTGDDYVLNQITAQLKKLHDVKKIMQLDEENSIFREIILIKVKANKKDRSQIIEIAKVFRAKIVDLATESITIELTGSSRKTEGFLELLKPHGILDIARTGLTAMERGNSAVDM